MKNSLKITLMASLLGIISGIEAKQMVQRAPIGQTTPNQISRPMIPGPQPKVQEKTEEELIEDAQDVLKSIPEERTYTSDITGYTQEQKEAAQDIFRRLAKQEKIIQTLITKKEEPFIEKGWFKNYIKPGKEEEYEDVKDEIQDLKNLLAQIQKNMRDQEIITGAKWSTAYKLGLGSVLTVTALGGGIYAIGGKAALATPSQWSPLVTTALYNWWSQVKVPSAKEMMFKYLPKGVSGLTALLNAKSLAQQATNELSYQITGEENQPNPNQATLDELHAKLDAQNKKIEQLETAIAKEQNK
jgi:hypothetical protein